MAHKMDCAVEFALSTKEPAASGRASNRKDLFGQYRSGKEVTHGFGLPSVDYEGGARGMLTPRPSRAFSDLNQALSSDVGKGGSDSKGNLAQRPEQRWSSSWYRLSARP